MEGVSESREAREFEPGVKIYLLRHADKPSDAEEPELPEGIEEEDFGTLEQKEAIDPNLKEWHEERHTRGLAPRLPKESWVDLGRFIIKDNSLSVEGIKRAHDFSKDKNLVEQTLLDFPDGKIKIRFLNTEAYRTTETNQIIAEELGSELKKLKEQAIKSDDTLKLRELERITVEKPSIDGESNHQLDEEIGEDPQKSAEDIERFITEMAENASSHGENLVVFAATHADKIRNYLEETTGKPLGRDIDPTESIVVKD